MIQLWTKGIEPGLMVCKFKNLWKLNPKLHQLHEHNPFSFLLPIELAGR